MIPQSLSSLWAWLAPAAANHLWQSTVFALGAAALTLLLRKNQARARYWLWLAASIKFLVPFALLMALGSFLAPARAPAGMLSGYSYAAEISQPFTQLTMPVAAAPSAHQLTFTKLLPAAVLLLWLVGFVAVLASWFLRWRCIRAAVRRAVPVDSGGEVDALRRLEHANQIHRPIPLRLSAESFEPGIFGIFHPVLLWPMGISAYLSDEHLEAILAHELQHVRYRDNLAAALHAFVQAIFWFHPLVWWMGAQLVRERERGCDEEVIEMGGHPGVYAEGILKACEFCIASPLASFSGVTGADLKTRIVRIMSGACGHRLTPCKKRLLLAAGAAAFAAPLLLGLVSLPHLRAQLLQASGPLPSFEVATIKPSRSDQHVELGISAGTFTVKNLPMREVINFAYNISSKEQLSGAPSWLGADKYDIDAKVDQATYRKLERLPQLEQFRLMTQALLASRLHLKTSVQTRELPVYALTVAKRGAKLQSPPAAQKAGGSHFAGIRANGRGELSGISAPTALLADALSGLPELGGRVVLDETDLKGYYDWTLKWTPTKFGSLHLAPQDGSSAGAFPADASGPSLFTALQEQLGLKLVPTKGPVQILVIDHIERPSPD